MVAEVAVAVVGAVAGAAATVVAVVAGAVVTIADMEGAVAEVVVGKQRPRLPVDFPYSLYFSIYI